MRYVFFAMILCSCYTQKKADRQLIKAKLNHPDVVAKKASEWFPCVTSQQSIDSSEIKKWMAMIDSISNEIQLQIDTIEIIKRDTIKQKDLVAYQLIMNKYISSQSKLKALLNAKSPVVYVTKVVVDSARFESMRLENMILQESKDRYQLKYETYLRLCLWLLIPFTISVILNVLKFKR